MKMKDVRIALENSKSFMVGAMPQIICRLGGIGLLNVIMSVSHVHACYASSAPQVDLRPTRGADDAPIPPGPSRRGTETCHFQRL